MTLQENLHLAWQLLPIETLNTIYMVLASTLASFLFGIPLGILLWMNSSQGWKERKVVFGSLNFLVNLGRSIPFAILMVAIIPFTRFVVGTSIGTTASIVPLSLAAIPFMARLSYRSFCEVDKGVQEAAIVMGTTLRPMIWKVLIPEALPSLVAGLTLTAVTLVGYSAMAGLVGGGGLGKVAIQYGYQRFNGTLMALTLVLILLLVIIIEAVGAGIVRHMEKKRGKHAR